MHLRGQVLHEIPHPLLNGWGGDDVVVVEREDNLLSLMAHQLIGQDGQHGLYWRGLWRVQQRECRRPDAGIKRLQSSHQVGEKASSIVVFWFQREPGDRLARFSEPLSKQGGFAKPGGGRNEGERTRSSLLEVLDQMRAGHQGGTWARDIEFGCQKGGEWITLLQKMLLCLLLLCLRGRDESQGFGANPKELTQSLSKVEIGAGCAGFPARDFHVTGSDHSRHIGLRPVLLEPVGLQLFVRHASCFDALGRGWLMLFAHRNRLVRWSLSDFQYCRSFHPLTSHQAYSVVGLMFWLRWKKLVGSYLFFRATNRS